MRFAADGWDPPRDRIAPELFQRKVDTGKIVIEVG